MGAPGWLASRVAVGRGCLWAHSGWAVAAPGPHSEGLQEAFAQAWDLLRAHQGLPAQQVCPSLCCALLSWVIPMDWAHSCGEPV